jgi:hypothetical protein
MWFELISSLGLTYILKYGSILKKIRDILSTNSFFNELFKCSLCLGFWSGVILSPLIFIKHGTVYALLFPTAAAAFSWTIDTIHDFIVKH